MISHQDSEMGTISYLLNWPLQAFRIIPQDLQFELLAIHTRQYSSQFGVEVLIYSILFSDKPEDEKLMKFAIPGNLQVERAQPRVAIT